ncbi:hypothetical protein BSP75_20395 [Aeromonas sp. YN13HZO-058]|uniref:hypothetical protein n=1 Tax=Aeromonas sp. YN13HZO-058 TaxID=1921564 RepID=UPI000946A88F|nr:hypothetical protein [Aeromonas sp. YN13HZO-058]OLF19757.1 hypothetical protein BSP75_20395 [Aeromonas sp. YN13HZO-058]
MATFLPSRGFLVVVQSQSGSGNIPFYNVESTDGPDWAANFGDTADLGIFRFIYGSGAGGDTGVLPTKTITLAPRNYVFRLEILNASWTPDFSDMDLELLDDAGLVLAAIRTRTDGNYRHGLWYGPNLASLTKAPQAGSYPITFGALSFTDSALVFTSDPDSNRNQSFSFACQPQKFAAMRFSNLRAQSTYTGNASAFVRVIIQKGPTQFNGDFAALTAEQHTALKPDFVLPAGAAITHQPGVGLVASGTAPSYALARSILPGQTGVLFDAAGAVAAKLAYINGMAVLTVGGVTTQGPADAPYLGLAAINGQVFGYYQTKVFVRSTKFIAPPKTKIWIELQPGATLAKIGIESVPLQVEFTYVLFTTPMTITVANQETRAQYLPQDMAWQGKPPFYPGPLSIQQMSQRVICKGRDYFWIRDGVRNVEQGYIESTVTISGMGVRRRVLCFTQDGDLVGETYSRAADGVYRFDLLWLNRRYMLVAQDDPAFGPADYNAVAADYQAPKPYQPGEGVAPAPFPMLAPLKRK